MQSQPLPLLLGTQILVLPGPSPRSLSTPPTQLHISTRKLTRTPFLLTPLPPLFQQRIKSTSPPSNPQTALSKPLSRPQAPREDYLKVSARRSQWMYLLLLHLRPSLQPPQFSRLISLRFRSRTMRKTPLAMTMRSHHRHRGIFMFRARLVTILRLLLTILYPLKTESRYYQLSWSRSPKSFRRIVQRMLVKMHPCLRPLR